MKAKINYILILFLITINLFQSTKDIALKDLLEKTARYHFGEDRVNYLVFEINHNTIHNVKYYASFLEDFLNGNGLETKIYTLKNQVYVAFIREEKVVDLIALRKHFKAEFKNIDLIKN